MANTPGYTALRSFMSKPPSRVPTPQPAGPMPTIGRQGGPTFQQFAQPRPGMGDRMRSRPVNPAFRGQRGNLQDVQQRLAQLAASRRAQGNPIFGMGQNPISRQPTGPDMRTRQPNDPVATWDV